MTPFSLRLVFASRAHVSQPKERIEQITDLYSLSLRSREANSESKLCLSLPYLVITITILRFMSYSCCPSAEKTDPKYMKLNTLSTSTAPLLVMAGHSACCASSFFFWIALSASLYLKSWALSGLWSRPKAKQVYFYCPLRAERKITGWAPVLPFEVVAVIYFFEFFDQVRVNVCAIHIDRALMSSLPI